MAWVDPASIRRNTRRPYPAWLGRHEDFGAVRAGDWDRRRHPEVEHGYAGTPPDLYLADRFEETVLHRSLAAHFEAGVAWEDTEFVAETRRRLESGACESIWNGCRSVEDVLDRCRRLDDLYETLRRSGFRSQRDLTGADDPASFGECIREEVLVDVGRDGELLLVNGRHRLSLARLLDVERIPVMFVVRHPAWMERRVTAADAGAPEDHPDLRDL